MTIVAGTGAHAVGQDEADRGPVVARIFGKARSWPAAAAAGISSDSQSSTTSFSANWQAQIASHISSTSAQVEKSSIEAGHTPVESAAGYSVLELPAQSSASAKSAVLRMKIESDPTKAAKPGASRQVQAPPLNPATNSVESLVHARPFIIERTGKPSPFASAEDTSKPRQDVQRCDGPLTAALSSLAIPYVLPAGAMSSFAASAPQESSQLAELIVAPGANPEGTINSDAQQIVVGGGFEISRAIKSGSTIALGSAAPGPKDPNPDLARDPVPAVAPGSTKASFHDQAASAGPAHSQRIAQTSDVPGAKNTTGPASVESFAPGTANGRASTTRARTVSATTPQPAQQPDQYSFAWETRPAQVLPTSSSNSAEDTLNDAGKVGALSLPVTPPKIAASSSAGNGRSGEQPPSRSSRGAISTDRTEHFANPLTAASGVTVPESSGQARNPAAEPEISSSAPGHLPGSVAGSPTHEAFAALDADANSSSSNWNHVGTRRAEAGYQDPALGWIGVRADLSGGGVHATLLPSSPEAAATLSGHIGGLDAFLAAEHASVRSITVGIPEGREAAFTSGQNLGQAPNHGSSQGGNSEPQPDPRASIAQIPAATDRNRAAHIGTFDQPAGLRIYGGTHISVMA